MPAWRFDGQADGQANGASKATIWAKIFGLAAMMYAYETIFSGNTHENS